MMETGPDQENKNSEIKSNYMMKMFPSVNDPLKNVNNLSQGHVTSVPPPWVISAGSC